MLGKLRKKIKKVVKSDPIVRKTSKVLKKTGGPAGKALGSALDGSSRKRRATGTGVGTGTERHAVLTRENSKGIGTGGNSPKSSVKAPGVSRPGQKHSLASTPGSRSRVPEVINKRPTAGVSRPAPKTSSTPFTPGGTAFSKSAGNSLQQLGRRRKMARY